MPLARATAPVVLCLLAGLLTAGCGGSDRPAAEQTPAPTSSPTSIRQLDTDQMRVVRVAFCDLVPRRAVRAALAGAPTRARSWRSGGEVKEAGGEIGHELGCAWFGPHGRAARAWVFARPVSPAYARTLTRAADRDPGCRARAQARFGEPGLVQTCERSGSPRRLRYAGLFGQTWLTCEVSGHGPAPALRGRADAWCAGVAGALDAGRA